MSMKFLSQHIEVKGIYSHGLCPDRMEIRDEEHADVTGTHLRMANPGTGWDCTLRAWRGGGQANYKYQIVTGKKRQSQLTLPCYGKISFFSIF